MIPPYLTEFPHDEGRWGIDLDPENPEDSTTERVNTYLVLFIVRSGDAEYRDRGLWEEFHESFVGWGPELFALATRGVMKRLRMYLASNGVYVERATNSYNRVIMHLLQEEEPHVWTEGEIIAQLEDNPVFNSRLNPVYRQGSRPRTPPIRDTIERAEAREDVEVRLGAVTAQTSAVLPQNVRREGTPISDVRRSTVPPEETPRQDPEPYVRFNPELHPSLNRETAVRTQAEGGASYETRSSTRQLTDMAKIYNHDDKKYGGEKYEFLDIKLQVFFDFCYKVGLDEGQYHHAFSIMLKGRATDFYYEQISGRLYEFARMVKMTKEHFETEENRQEYLSEWRATTLFTIIEKYPDKTKLECLELLFNKLRTVQRGLSSLYQYEHSLRDQVLNACRGVEECNYALFKPAASYEGLCADLRSSVSAFAMSRGAIGSSYEQHWTDRTFGGQTRRHENVRHGSNSGPFQRGYRTNTLSRGNFQSGTPRTSSPRANQKCYVCQKQGCWSNRHSAEERSKAYTKYKEQLVTEMGLPEDQLDQFLMGIEGSPNEEPPREQGTDRTTNDDLDFQDTPFGNWLMETATGVDGGKLMAALDEQATRHIMTREDPSGPSYEAIPMMSAFTFESRYSSDEFHGIMPDSGASGVSTVGEPQFQALQKLDDTVVLTCTKNEGPQIRFGKGMAGTVGTAVVRTPFGPIVVHVVKANTPFLWCIQDMDRLNVKFDNLSNTLVQGEKIIPVVRKWGHPWLQPWLLENNKEVVLAYNHLTETELRRLHSRLGHPSVRRLVLLLQRAGYDDISSRTIEKFTKFCKFCQTHQRSPGRYRISLKWDIEFNHSVIIDILWIDGYPVLHAVDEATAFNAARFLVDETAKHVWDTLRTMWVLMYQGPPDRWVHDAGKNFASSEFRQNARILGSEVHEVPVEAHNSVGKVERYHTPLRRSYDILTKELKDEKLSKESVLQMAVKAVNDTAGPDGLVPTLLVFGAYPRMSDHHAPAPNMVVRANAIRTAMREVRKVKAKRQVTDALAMRNGPRTEPTLMLPIGSEVLVWREKEGWAGPYMLLAINGTECTIEMPYGPTNFRVTVVKPFFREKEKESEIIHETPFTDKVTDEMDPRTDETDIEIDLDSIQKPESRSKEPQTTPKRTLRVEIPHRTVADMEATIAKEAFLTKRERDDLVLAQELRTQGKITTPGLPFEASAEQEIAGLIARDVFEFVQYDSSIHRGRVFNSRLVNEVKGKTTLTPYEKSRLVIQAYNDAGKEEILTQSPTIMRPSQRIIMALAPSLVRKNEGMILFSRDITQAYVQSETELNRTILARLPRELQSQYPEGTIMVVRRPLYGVPEAGLHWWATYNRHHKENLHMTSSSYDPCLLISTTQEAFAVVGMQTDDTLILGNQEFVVQEERELKKAGFSAKPINILSYGEPLVFNGCVIQKNNEDLVMIPKGQGQKIELIDLDSVLRTQVYREQRARGAYLSSICQPEASFDLSIAAQHQDPSSEEITILNKRLEWQVQNQERGIRYIVLDLSYMKLFVFVDGSFANNKDLSSQIGFEIILGNEIETDGSYEGFKIKGNLIHWSSTKSKRVTRSVLASEIYGMVAGVDMAIVINTTIGMIADELKIPRPQVIVCTDSYSLYECLVKLGTTKEKRLMIDIMALRQSYERRELAEIRWINGEDNPADAMTKASPNKALERFLDTNELSVRMEGWVTRKEK